jgi:malate dehydrogenase (oxaloacetate-decarboxylating)
MSDIKLGVTGVGAAGVACSKIIMAAGVKNVIGCDQSGAIYEGRREHMNWVKDWYARNTNPNKEQGAVHDVIKGADVFLGVSVPGVIVAEDVKHMAGKPIVFAMANPTPEIMPEEAEPYVAVMATGRSDYPNQINNVLCFPGIFRGALACRASRINEEMNTSYLQFSTSALLKRLRARLKKLRTVPASRGGSAVVQSHRDLVPV